MDIHGPTIRTALLALVAGCAGFAVTRLPVFQRAETVERAAESFAGDAGESVGVPTAITLEEASVGESSAQPLETRLSEAAGEKDLFVAATMAFAIIDGLASAEDLRAGIALANSFSAGKERDSVLGALLPSLAEAAPVEALEAGARQRFRDQRAWRGLLEIAAGGEPVATAAWLEQAGPDMLWTHAASVGSTWAKTDPVAALDWAARLGVVTAFDIVGDPPPTGSWAYVHLTPLECAGDKSRGRAGLAARPAAGTGAGRLGGTRRG